MRQASSGKVGAGSGRTWRADWGAHLMQAVRPASSGPKRTLFAAIGWLERLRSGLGPQLPIEDLRSADGTPIDRYWTETLVNPDAFLSSWQSAAYLRWRNRLYPEAAPMMELWGRHEGQTVLDYGCGPGDDSTGFWLTARPERLISMDVSPTALALTAHRLRLHGATSDRVRLILTDDSVPTIPLEDASVDFINSNGVIHHATDPMGILKEFHRVLKPRGRANVMVYNWDSVWAHLMVGWWDMLVYGRFDGLTLEQAVERTVDGLECPVARFYRHEEFISMCNEAGMEASFLGGYFCPGELHELTHRRAVALQNPGLRPDSREFLEALRIDERGRAWCGKYLAGWGGVYHLTNQ